MANFIISPNMGLPVPTPGVDPGPDYASNLQSSLNILDGHNHSNGQGVLITPSGLDINADLPINGNNLNLVNTVNFLALLAPLAGSSPNLGCIYVAGNELFYNDESGNVVAITKTGSVNAGAGSITGLPSGTASASYSAGSQTFIWQSATSTPANMDAGSYIFRNITANSNGATVSAPNSLAFDYNLTLPIPPSINSFVILDPSGNFGTTLTSTLADQVGTTMTSTGANAVANSRTRATGTTVPVGGVAISGSSGAFNGGTNSTFVPITNQSVTITTSGRPVMIKMIPDGSLSQSSVFAQNTIQGLTSVAIGFFNGATQLSDQLLQVNATSAAVPIQISGPPSQFSTIDFPAAGTYTYTAQGKLAGGTQFTVNFVSLCVYEL